MRQCMSCNLVLQNSQTYLDHIKPGPLRQCSTCELIFEVQCEFELHQLVEHPKRKAIGSAAMTKESPLPNPAVTAREQGFRYIPLDEHMETHTLGNPTVETAETQTSQFPTDPRHMDDLLLGNLVDGSPIPAPSGTASKGIPMALSGPPEGDLLDLSPPNEESGTLSKAISNFQDVLKNRPALERTVVKDTPSQTQEVQLKKRVPVTSPATSSGSPHPATITPESSELIKTPLQIRPVPEAQQQPNVQTSGILCFECGATFTNILALHQHQMVSKHNYCHWCLGFFADRSVLQKHKEQVHNFRCTSCNAAHFNLEDLITHQRLKAHCYCKACNSYFLDLKSHQQHMATFHDNSRHGPSRAEPAGALKPKAPPAKEYSGTAAGTSAEREP
ncbi:predicted protein [Uncinocarpus reesii 1704]|uniref:C2H2-type domain-containing protein n=1 Tax=Uncinocarpus reesii (strain UAMH 1704) TaxID=336963 RepID=C4JQ24_UNCRE|nr:uncharacterized protein UREG_03257 [Uncinocarpus reesii 1704]EEP78411.1 predicted protein [Uncinocarpus reesii 1704]